MRLSAPEVSPAGATAVIHAALDAGVTLLDTAGAYGPRDRETGHNERLVASALASWGGDRSRVRVATKGGLTRPGGRWVADGRARHLVAAAEASRAALGADAIDLYQLHAVDPRTPLATSVRALAELRAAGVVRAIGLCNVSLGQLVEASDVADIDAVQVPLSLWEDDALYGGLVEHCRERGVALLCHTPLGGPERWRRRANHPVLRAVGRRRGASPAEVALAWLCDLSPDGGVVPLPGATRPETAASAAAGQRLALDPADRAALDPLAPAGRIARAPRAERRPRPARPDTDVVLVMGSPGAGKSTWARGLVERGYRRLNRDLTGGTLAGLAAALEAGLAAGETRFVLDNTYASRASRGRVLEAAWRHRVDVRCVWLDTSLEDAQWNAALRLVERHGRLPGPDELRRLSRRDPTALSPRALFEYRRALEPPTAAEGLASIELVRFERLPDPARTARALILDLDAAPDHAGPDHAAPDHAAPDHAAPDGAAPDHAAPDHAAPDGAEASPASVADSFWFLTQPHPRPSVSDRAAGPATPGDAGRDPGAPDRPRAADELRRWREAGWLLLAMAWRPGVATGATTADEVDRRLAALRGRLGLDDAVYCPHGPGPPVCWCRPPLPGLVALLAHRHGLDPARCRLVGRAPAGRAFAARLGMRWTDPAELARIDPAGGGTAPPAR
jgi:aryl-alcohol dehydrogenase-like predicted oxidoreductase